MSARATGMFGCISTSFRMHTRELFSMMAAAEIILMFSIFSLTHLLTHHYPPHLIWSTQVNPMMMHSANRSRSIFVIVATTHQICALLHFYMIMYWGFWLTSTSLPIIYNGHFQTNIHEVP
ncbi:hypothetical protein GGS21DRAFT_528728 [Xylaria nigripes]|nr:hypothetical protein GGS21DRAFT_528728 [Xylaria nigripes]